MMVAIRGIIRRVRMVKVGMVELIGGMVVMVLVLGRVVVVGVVRAVGAQMGRRRDVVMVGLAVGSGRARREALVGQSIAPSMRLLASIVGGPSGLIDVIGRAGVLEILARELALGRRAKALEQGRGGAGGLREVMGRLP